MKKIINNFLNLLGYNISKKINYNFDHIYIKYFNDGQKKIFFDIGANEGQTINRFNKICNNFEIHAFEPLKSAYELLNVKFSNNDKVKLNNCALGEKLEKKKIKVFKNSANSSFNGPLSDSLWESKKKIKLNSNELISTEEEVDVKTVDNYCEKKMIKKLDLLKIDVQGWEEKVLIGAEDTLKSRSVKFIEVEFIMGNQYENRLNIIDIEKHLINNKFRLFGISQRGDLLNKSDISLDLLYANTDYIEVK